ncbi:MULTISPECIES: LacI family DNA-binding transcriptional regulator [unclassified Microbacterium]|uniref:LacI family DNA-binding transcriptional regulator n=1 Tax=unclassified Microbacterium TaxID=2609290 RepID=UPI00191E0FD0|nr:MULTISPECIES: LacI family DNA-binding transcriptional regulator [unclassified Microbacterium]QYM63787.1 hypothetical protein K1X59_16810 [Microbacterium sp. Se5.02b]
MVTAPAHKVKRQIIAAEMRERVLSAIDGLGFVRTNAARSLVTGRADTVGFVVLARVMLEQDPGVAAPAL